MVNKVMIIAGEASGDLHGAGVVRELKRRNPNVEVYGVGGDNMRREGMHLIYHIRELGFMGFAEVIRHLPLIRALSFTLEQILTLKRPDVVLLIDYPGFNLRFAKKVKARGIKVIYYISPQVWAWHRSRVKTMREVVDKMLVILPFEVDFYRSEGIEAEFVGHPLLEVLTPNNDGKNFRKRYGLDPEKPLLVLLPGSRRQEIEQIFPDMLSAGKAVARELGYELAVGIAPTLEERYFRTLYSTNNVKLIKGVTHELMEYAAFAFVTSGTATLETALFGTPMLVVYRTSWLTYLIGRLLVRVKNIGLVNIVAGKKIVPEFIQHRASARAMAQAAMEILEDEQRLLTMREDLRKVRGLLGTSGASRTVAERILAIA
ncbi:MAG: lipid-A-disaccharide synthase [Ignavibacteria bacterium GWA2_55_11]|nr:MAG: lipid-A-disaccharide synthase [Ignavibacteria bacterium GWA2_55_11]OGU44002.1 MAG: lipid-A-disaccharide synthase [Ignavibacteria bacterium GWC2_56_12]OGU65167.1 MAG: lipid-A-disaccharide synthase [Ignavibacteria bacterium RIFCSPHIGHO2_02_FULL_56_12]OGU71737.1 MAG: lipid-A-disaccharide synthase [Ignavibacteria bacterium RIFCSPLOWO2_02_FULL_55_14]OGU73695.1 MAG: lipid-A-disaccharide synthase [Ignavibacteria bacterium RIFCSPLOWO2_12_FULL_56_21]